MYTHFDFLDKSNPYIAFTNKRFFYMLINYDFIQIDKFMFYVSGLRQKNGKLSYKDKKAVLQNFAQEWQYNFSSFNYSYYELLEWNNFFKEYGKKYGLLKEFKENAIY